MNFSRLLIKMIVSSFCVLAQANEIHIEPLRSEVQINEYYCKVTTGTPANLKREPCFTPNRFPMDIIYLPETVGRKIVSHIDSAWQRKMYLNVDKSDFFHGHPITKGPQTTYESPQEYLENLVGVLYHSAEYTDRWRYDTSDPKIPRSFIGRMDEFFVVAAIDLMLPDASLWNYKDSGTIYLEQLLESQKSWSKHTGKEKIFMKTGIGEKPCEVLNSIHFIEDPKGRFRLESGEIIELIMECKYK